MARRKGPACAGAWLRGATSVAVSWSAPAQTGGTPITRYTVHGSPHGSCSTTGATHCTVTRLTQGTSYTFTVTATNAVGTGPASPPSLKVTPRARAITPALTSALRWAIFRTPITVTGTLLCAHANAKLAYVTPAISQQPQLEPAVAPRRRTGDQKRRT